MSRRHSRRMQVARELPPPFALQHAEYIYVRGAAYSTGAAPLRRSGLHHSLLERGLIDSPGWQWVEGYGASLELLEGAKPGKGETERVDESAAGFLPANLAAAERVARAHAVLDVTQRAVIVCACVLALPVISVAENILRIPRGAESDAAYRGRVARRVERAVVAAIDAVIPPRAAR